MRGSDGERAPRWTVLRNGALVACVGSFLVILAACGGGGSSPDWGTLEIPAATDVVIGVIGEEGVPPTVRTQVRNGLDLALTDTYELLGHRVRTEHAAGSCADAVLDLLGTEGLVAVLVVACGDDLAAALSMLAEARITTLLAAEHGPLPVDDAPVLRLTWSDADAAPVQGRFLRSVLGVESLVVVRSQSSAARGASEAFRLGQAAGGVDVIGERTLQPGDDPAAIAGDALVGGVDALYVALEPEEALRLAEALRVAGFSAAVLLAPSASDPALFGLRFDGAAAGVYLTRVHIDVGESEEFDAWRRRYAERFQITLEIDDLALPVYDGVTALLAALSRTQQPEPDGTLQVERYGLFAALRDRGGDGVGGLLRFNEDGEREALVQVDFLQVQGAELVPVG